MLPGDVFNRDKLIQSYRNIANLGFFEQDMAPPETRTANENGDIDLVFHVSTSLDRLILQVSLVAALALGLALEGKRPTSSSSSSS